VKDVVLLSNSRKISSHAIDRDELDIPDACIKSYAEELEDVLREVFGALWNACGEARPEK
jgi:hypothetical protein